MKFLKKHSDIVVIISVILICIVVALCITFSGLKNGDYDYVSIKVNPEVEFITNKDTTVKSVKPLNSDGAIVISGDSYVGMKVKDAITKFLTECASLGYIDMEADEESSTNAVKMTVVSGLTNSLELGVYEAINKFLKDNAIFGVIVENEKDMQIIKSAKKDGIASPDKMELINTILDSDDSKSLDDIKGKTEEELIDMIIAEHDQYEMQDLSEIKSQRLSEHQEVYKNHVSSLTNEKKRDFNTKFVKYSKKRTSEYEKSYDDKYDEYISSMYG